MDDRGTLSAEYTYAITNLQESCLRGKDKERTTNNTFKEAMSLPKAVHWKAAASKGIASILVIESSRLEGHGITIPLRIRWNELYSFVLDLSAAG